MNWKRIIGVIAILAVVTIVIVRLRINKEATQQKVYQYDKEKPIVVQVDTIQLQTIDDATAYTGIFEPNKETKISAEVQGKINSVLVDIGSNVNKGQALIRLDNSLLKLQLQSAEVLIQGLQDDVNRYTILVKADAVQGVQLEKAQLGLKSAKVQKATLLEQISKTTVKAPFNGVVTLKLSEEGAFAAPGVPLLQITDYTSLRFTVNVPENDLKQFRLGEAHKISADAYPDIALSGKVSMIGSKANIGNSFPVQFQLA
ncbi:MAG: efflux RND transporter periplasmic adaptor subunit, partial [Chitinophagaceae bacterium]